MENLKDLYYKHQTRIEFLVPLAYAVLLLLGVLYIRSVLNSPEVEVQKPPKEEKKEARNEKEIDVSLVIIDENGNVINEYAYKIENKKTVDDLMQELRANNDMFYEKVAYLDGLKVEQLLKRQIGNNMSWQIYLADTNVTNDIEQATFIDNDNASQVKIVLEPNRKL